MIATDDFLGKTKYIIAFGGNCMSDLPQSDQEIYYNWQVDIWLQRTTKANVVKDMHQQERMESNANDQENKGASLNLKTKCPFKLLMISPNETQP